MALLLLPTILNLTFGNTCNGEAPLNPTYRFSVIERQSYAAVRRVGHTLPTTMM